MKEAYLKINVEHQKLTFRLTTAGLEHLCRGLRILLHSIVTFTCKLRVYLSINTVYNYISASKTTSLPAGTYANILHMMNKK